MNVRKEILFLAWAQVNNFGITRCDLELFGNVESKCVITKLSLVHPISHPSTQFNCVYLVDTRLEPTTNRILHNAQIAHRYF